MARGLDVPSLDVPECPAVGTVAYNTSVPNNDTAAFPETKASLCYDDSFIRITFTALQEEYFYYNNSVPTNGDIYDYEVMEAFIYRGVNDPQTYLEFEVAPNNVTFSAWIYNPSKVRATGAAFTGAYITSLVADQLSANTTIVRSEDLWYSHVQIPLGFFNVDTGKAKGTRWRMNFFRTVTSAELFPTQYYGAWNPPNETNFHMTPFFGHVYFV
ncbi:hypothetical protein M406DRAFT_279552 [Cryphonectria parasitica EP155]|uniref:Carbohydrate-binding domain-containing protein n=1 Tax=Cryphonectria parasitica (strain ATCC 38755 / EP155) TaxID=660469 RepID=A0A9P4XYQ2_CRYP1|nr:uncharacterized protein M406DRAFT_279552 [Cryphonectria parasitica EP155]KAF3763453.1 hypothetical protein M406DRAFT_279552 [Cryphonectria parasitica EP155]